VHLASFVQDDWRLHPRVSLNLGVRYEVDTDVNNMSRVDQLNPLVLPFVDGPRRRDMNNVAPRLGFNWSTSDSLVNLESSAKTNYDGLLVELERRFSGRYGLRLSYTLSKAMNYANDDQIPFGNGPVDPNNLAAEYGPSPSDQRHRLALSGMVAAGGGVQIAGLWRAASGVPMDILMPDGQSRIPVLSRNAGGRVFRTAADLDVYLTTLNASGGIDKEPLLELFNLVNTTNILGTSTVNYSGFSNVLVRDSNDPANPGYLKSSAFGTPISTAGGVFGSGGPFAVQLGARVTF